MLRASWLLGGAELECDLRCVGPTRSPCPPHKVTDATHPAFLFLVCCATQALCPQANPVSVPGPAGRGAPSRGDHSGRDSSGG